MMPRLPARHPLTRLFTARVPGVSAFSIAAILPVPLLLAGSLAGGIWPWVAVAYLTCLTWGLDVLIARAAPDAPEGTEFPAADSLSVVLALSHLVLLAVAVMVLARADLTWAERAGIFFGHGIFFGQVSNANAHELIHRGSRVLHGLGVAVYVSLLFGHHASAHRLVHHSQVATDADPNSARRGESYYRFAPRAWVGSFRAGLAAERSLCARKPGRLNPYVVYVGGGLGIVLAVAVMLGARGVLDYLLLCLWSQAQLLLSDYVQHYGLRRRIGPDGRPEPVSARHSWDAPHPMSSLLMLNAPRHSDHHAHPLRAYPALRLDPEAGGPARPILPYPLPMMATLALWPGRFRKLMHPRLAALEAAR
ncbi:alkane 1-monooxygenase [Paracoccus sp. p4-l81]|uniref:alkane 1-monooxygenase n=1 Tax=unclassified Paracoccus (in: a-proteobacteria) TaxID=2688777 RepID=UPI0035B889FC